MISRLVNPAINFALFLQVSIPNKNLMLPAKYGLKSASAFRFKLHIRSCIDITQYKLLPGDPLVKSFVNSGH